MRLLSIFTTQPVLPLIQFIVSAWFIFDFFLARDSLTASSLWKASNGGADTTIKNLQDQASKIREHHCPTNNKSPLFDKLVFIVVDALGTEFLPSFENDQAKEMSMPFLERAIRDKKAIAFKGKAATPTVTMPRIKALLSGTIPSFLDLMYNLASDVSKFDDDNIINIAKRHDKSIIFYGDDTWLSLFDRSLFKRAKETFSMFAHDYTQIDTNVTELALPETQLVPLDWDYMFLHYLGLDHIGHLYGTNKNILINNKLLEMDKVIEEIYENMRKKDSRTLLVVCGDHGMSEEGNHGGGSRLEVDTIMAFLPINIPSTEFKYSKPAQAIHQIDMAVTLSLLMRLPIPSMSRGVAVEKLLESFMNPNELACASLENTMQLVSVKGTLDSSLTHDLDRIFEFHKNSTDSNLSDIATNYLKLGRKIQENLIEIVITNSNPILIIVALVLVSLSTLVGAKKASTKMIARDQAIPILETLICLATFFIPIVMPGSTDFIESEHYFWPIYSLSNFILLVLAILRSKPKIFKDIDPVRIGSFLVTYLITSTWNHIRIMRDSRIVPIIALIFLCNSLRQNSDLKNNLKKISFLSIGVLLMLTQCLEEEPSVLEQRLVLLVVLSYVAVNLASQTSKEQYEQLVPGYNVHPTSTFRLIGKLASSWLLISFLLVRRYNFIFLIANVIMEASLNAIIESLKLSTISRSLLYVHFAQAAFYNQGNTNLFTSIDVKPAFYGQTSYNLFLATPLCMISTYSTQIYWYLKAYQRIQNESSISTVGDFISSRNFLCLSYYMFVCVVLRNHLFIWSVISPKLIYLFVSNNILLMTTLFVQNLHNFKQIRLQLEQSKDSIN